MGAVIMRTIQRGIQRMSRYLAVFACGGFIDGISAKRFFISAANSRTFFWFWPLLVAFTNSSISFCESQAFV
jgi:hypothetical protein